MAGDRRSGSQVLSDVQRCLDFLVWGGGYSAYQVAGWYSAMPTLLIPPGGMAGEDMLFAQDTSPSCQPARRRGFRMMAQEAATKEVANSKLRRLYSGFTERGQSAVSRRGALR